MYESDKAGIGFNLNLLSPNAGFVRLWAEVSTIALILSIFAGFFREMAGTVMLIWLGIGVGKFLMRMFPSKKSEKQ